jgi:hypothetical protein
MFRPCQTFKGGQEVPAICVFEGAPILAECMSSRSGKSKLLFSHLSIIFQLEMLNFQSKERELPNLLGSY